jgi:hypothetical protein
LVSRTKKNLATLTGRSNKKIMRDVKVRPLVANFILIFKHRVTHELTHIFGKKWRLCVQKIALVALPKSSL